MHFPASHSQSSIGCALSGRVSPEGGSVVEFVAGSRQDYGTLQCWAQNTVGKMTEPCLYHVVPASKCWGLCVCVWVFGVCLWVWVGIVVMFVCVFGVVCGWVGIVVVFVCVVLFWLSYLCEEGCEREKNTQKQALSNTHTHTHTHTHTSRERVSRFH